MRKIVASLESRTDEIANVFIRKRYAILFCLPLFNMIVSPLRMALHWKTNITESLLAATLLVAVLPMHTAVVRRTLWVLVSLVFVARFFTPLLGPTLSSVNLGIWTLAGLLAAFNALRFTLRATSVKGESLVQIPFSDVPDHAHPPSLFRMVSARQAHRGLCAPWCSSIRS